MQLLGRLIRGAFALLLAVPAGASVLVAALLLTPGGGWLAAVTGAGIEGAMADLAAGLPPEGFALLVTGLAWAAFAVLVVPPVLVALVGEGLRRRSLVWYGGGCGLLTAAVPWLARGGPPPAGTGLLAAEAQITAVLFLAGAGAGWIYWLVAGHGGRRAR